MDFIQKMSLKLSNEKPFFETFKFDLFHEKIVSDAIKLIKNFNEIERIENFNRSE